MRPGIVLLSLLPLLAACEAAGPLAVVAGGSVALIGRTPVDVVASLVTGRDCSVVRLDRRESYCAPTEEPPAAQPYCTRSLGSVDCWTVPPYARPPLRSVADGPDRLNPAQEADRTAWGPGLAALVAVPPPPTVVVVVPPPVVIAPVEQAPVVRAEPIPDPPRRRAAPRPRPRPPQPACPCPQPAAAPAPAPAPSPAQNP